MRISQELLDGIPLAMKVIALMVGEIASLNNVDISLARSNIADGVLALWLRPSLPWADGILRATSSKNWGHPDGDKYRRVVEKLADYLPLFLGQIARQDSVEDKRVGAPGEFIFLIQQLQSLTHFPISP
ncbi:TPA: hypothetical protein ACGJWA_004219 [Pseudomonas aeruginosa]|uniref:hypothetical protein n=1 Tax=Pseudomonas aeruginosa TaxID=287 RepID=UPI00129859FE|nr:hypothetical protein [Pseudomonas aeruginosa]MBG4396795.1 hypothetical protein [Pseudomonas aeruginosa]HBN9879242.1 hypothetical protein [Pseudomonas aeruginosa]HBN9880039.1 hypothetical protein [Pseudomonas aeruginosa]HBO1241448.1 hypothetical protein [Pseudomonas aeruginosa]HBO1880710.1 hypothetical protein [Pseudomonas aeruginosa]